jgi:hypothetical protein
VRFLGASTRGPTRSPALLLELCDKSLLEIINQVFEGEGQTYRRILPLIAAPLRTDISPQRKEARPLSHALTPD